MNVDVLYLVTGAALLIAIILPRILERLPASAPIILILIGVIVGVLPWTGQAPVRPLEHTLETQHLAEITVIVSLMGVGLALDRPLRWRSLTSIRSWGTTWRLLFIAMPLCIACVAFLGWWAIGLAPATALLLGAALAPTDPVLAADVQVEGPELSGPSSDADGRDGRPDGGADLQHGVRRTWDEDGDGEGADGGDGAGDEKEAEPHVGENDEVRFALTSEAGLNDALAFPFVYAAIYLVTKGSVAQWGWSWLGTEIILKTVVGVLVGIAGGWALGHIAFRSRVDSLRLADRGEPLLALAATLAVYGLAEVAHGWGFLAVFVCALTLRAQERSHDYHGHMHDVIERLELLLTLLMLMLVGLSFADGVLDHLTWQGAAVGLALVFVVRPVCALLALGRGAGVDTAVGGELGPRERFVTAFFGVRGIGSIYYVAYALAEAPFQQAEELWATVAFTILVSVVVHGTTATPAMRWLEGARRPTAAATRE